MSPHYQKTLQPKHISRISKNLTKSKRWVVRYCSTNPEILKDPENKFGEKFKVSFVWWRQEPKEEKRSARKIKSSEERKTKKSQFGFNQTVFKSSNLDEMKSTWDFKALFREFSREMCYSKSDSFEPYTKEEFEDLRQRLVWKIFLFNKNMLRLENSFAVLTF